MLVRLPVSMLNHQVILLGIGPIFIDPLVVVSPSSIQVHTKTFRHTLKPSGTHLNIKAWVPTAIINSSGSSSQVREGPRNMNSMWSPLAAIFFMTYFNRTGGLWSPQPPGSTIE